ncbi:MAG: hypothetical protein RSC93_02260 [Erysipelotrichaceae bacterium]|mgnify:CR=1 FL=1
MSNNNFEVPLYKAIGTHGISFENWQKHVTDAYVTLRTHNSSIPDDILDLMKCILEETGDFTRRMNAFKE